MQLMKEKITFSVPVELKRSLEDMKVELGCSMSSILVEAIGDFREKLERKKWKKAANFMSEEYENNAELKDWARFEEDVLEP